ncbi:MAG: DinB family protein [Candidatus Heimdallarchaeota archaeon]
MVLKFVLEALGRHFDETRILLKQLTDENIQSKPVDTGRPLGEIILHMIRAFEFYSRGVATGKWEPLSYNLKKYSDVKAIQMLYEDVVRKTRAFLAEITPTGAMKTISPSTNSAPAIAFLLEMLEHSIQHRGQILVYYRLLGIEPRSIPYLI